MELFYFQKQANAQILAARTLGIESALLVMPTGSGKTVAFSGLTHELDVATVISAHRREIVSQIALTLARMGVRHNIIAPKASVREAMDAQNRKLGKSLIDPRAQVFVASVDTLNARASKFPSAWFESILLYIQDEAHHMLLDNKFGRAAQMFQSAFQLGVTATPLRADGRGLGAHCGGMYQTMILGPTGRRLIDEDFLSEYKLYAPENCFPVDRVKVTAGGDFSKPQLIDAAKENFIVGDIIQHYRELANGLKTIAFMPDIETSKRSEQKFRDAGIVAKHVDGETPSRERADAIRDFERGKINVLLNVDLFGEGFDVPAVEAVILGRPTWSYGLLSQQIGRGLRRSDNKSHSVIIDAVGNIMRHSERGLPDAPKISWSLDGGKAGATKTDGPPLRVCAECYRPFESYGLACPHCGHRPVVRVSRDIGEIEGNLAELSQDMLDSLRADAAKVSDDAQSVAVSMRAAGAPEIAIMGFLAKHRDRKKAQTLLRFAMSKWGGRERVRGLEDGARHVKFYRKFGTDVLSAQSLGRRRAEELTELIKRDLNNEAHR